MTNDNYFNYLKSLKNEFEPNNLKYPSLETINVSDNILQFEGMRLNLHDFELEYFNHDVFSFAPNEISYIIKTNIINLLDNEFIKKEVKYIEDLENLKEITEEMKQDIFNYINDYYIKKYIKDKYNYLDFDDELNQRIVPISNAYLKEDDPLSHYHNPASEYIRELEGHYYTKKDNSMSYEGPVLVRTKDSLMPNSYEVIDFKEQGFISSIIILILTICLGVVIGILLY